ncbi:cysteine hydrolase family protein [Pedobacter nutrimenti]|jgi:nicotinamidase-related amidase|uniref:Nicotinamidase-related amidase n=1 Tax=Pedobacter nutrimenti TaxID=1241337 RepID=A0A318UEL4_9SPHI|nr:isochorismatase family cysteine hydrolase [Pedobacter nutrimenti]PYF74822.1 nicotinamidase-related amidase [Pedobacter nutrimenti]
MESTKKTALLVMDLQNVILQHVTDPTEIISKVSSAIAEARAKTIPVIYVVVNFRPGAPEISELNKNFSRFGDKAMWTPEFCAQWGQIHPDLSPQEGDIVVTKRRFSAFTGSDLEVVLRGQGIQHLVLTGISTSGVVLSTLREAADKDFQLTVIKDCCADRDPEVHQVLMDKIFPVQAEVVSLGAWLS